MKIKCDDYLPDKSGEYETDLGKLLLKTHIVGNSKWSVWYRVTQKPTYKSFLPQKPIWWDNPNIKI